MREALQRGQPRPRHSQGANTGEPARTHLPPPCSSASSPPSGVAPPGQKAWGGGSRRRGALLPRTRGFLARRPRRCVAHGRARAPGRRPRVSSAEAAAMVAVWAAPPPMPATGALGTVAARAWPRGPDPGLGGPDLGLAGLLLLVCHRCRSARSRVVLSLWVGRVQIGRAHV